jgi:hypothetical protein
MGFILRCSDSDARKWGKAHLNYWFAWHRVNAPDPASVKATRKMWAQWCKDWRPKLRAINRDPILLPGLEGASINVLKPENEEQPEPDPWADPIEDGSVSASEIRKIEYRGVAPNPRFLKDYESDYLIVIGENFRSRSGSRESEDGSIPISEISHLYPREVREIMELISRKQRWVRIVAAYYGEGKTMERIAEEMSTTKSSIHRTIESIAKLFADRGLPHPAFPRRTPRAVPQVDPKT